MSRTVLRGRVDEATFVSAGEPAEERGEDMVYGLLWSSVEADAMLMIYGESTDVLRATLGISRTRQAEYNNVFVPFPLLKMLL